MTFIIHLCHKGGTCDRGKVASLSLAAKNNKNQKQNKKMKESLQFTLQSPFLDVMRRSMSRVNIEV